MPGAASRVGRSPIRLRSRSARAQDRRDRAPPANALPRPDFWGGFRLWFEAIELWVEGREPLPRARALRARARRARRPQFRDGPLELAAAATLVRPRATLDPVRDDHLSVLLGVDRDHARPVGRGATASRGLLGVLPADRHPLPRRRTASSRRSTSRRRIASEVARSPRCCSSPRHSPPARKSASPTSGKERTCRVRARAGRRHARRRSRWGNCGACRRPAAAPCRSRRPASKRATRASAPTASASSINAAAAINGISGCSTWRRASNGR